MAEGRVSRFGKETRGAAAVPEERKSRFGNPGDRNPAKGLPPTEIEGEVVVVEVIAFGEEVTKFSVDGAPKPYVDVLVTPVTGKHTGEQTKTRWLGAYLVSDLRGYGPGEPVLARMVKDAPKPGKPVGWLLRTIDDAKTQALAEAVLDGLGS